MVGDDHVGLAGHDVLLPVFLDGGAREARAEAGELHVDAIDARAWRAHQGETDHAHPTHDHGQGAEDQADERPHRRVDGLPHPHARHIA